MSEQLAAKAVITTEDLKEFLERDLGRERKEMEMKPNLTHSIYFLDVCRFTFGFKKGWASFF